MRYLTPSLRLSLVRLGFEGEHDGTAVFVGLTHELATMIFAQPANLSLDEGRCEWLELDMLSHPVTARAKAMQTTVPARESQEQLLGTHSPSRLPHFLRSTPATNSPAFITNPIA